MNITPDDAMRGMPPADVTKLDPELEFDIQSAVAANDLGRIFGMVARIASERDEAVEALRIRLSHHFKRDFSKRTFNQFLERERDRARVAAPRQSVLPAVQVNNRALREMVAPALEALRNSNDPPHLFVRAGEIVYISVDQDGRPSIAAATEAYVRGRLDRAADFVRSRESGDVKVPPPIDVVRDLMALSPSEWGLPPLVGVVEVPTMRADGTILGTPGYDAGSRLYYKPAPSLDIPPVPEDPCTDDIQAAIECIDDAIGEFPYVNDAQVETPGASKANLLGLLLTPLVRPAVRSSVPIAIIDAPKAGTGKSLLMDVFSVIVTGRPMQMMPFPEKEEEVQKSIASTLLTGSNLICFDNVESSLRSPNLALALTAKEYQCRILGLTRNMVAENRATWMVTGNNVQVAGDMPRRCYKVRLDPRSSKPFTGRTFRHENLLEWVSENRGKLLHSLLTIARAWYYAGRPSHVSTTLGTFEDWHRTIAGILGHAGVRGFLSNAGQIHDQGDDAALQWENFLTEIQDRLRSEFTAADVVDLMRRDSDLFSTLPDSLADIDIKKPNVLQRAIGRSFAKRVDTRYGDSQIHVVRGKPDGHTKVATWRIDRKPITT